MMIKESSWIWNQFSSFRFEEINPIINIGSSTWYFRSVVQPFINRNIFLSLQERGLSVDHLDLKDAEGVNIVWDLSDKDFLKKLEQKHYSFALCSNVLEHLVDRAIVTNAISDILGSGWFLLVTVPYVYPYHKDPIDNQFRPNIQQLASLFPSFQLIDGQIIKERESLFISCVTNPKRFVRMFLRFINFLSPDWNKHISYLPYFFTPYSSTCVLLKKA